MVFFKYLLFCYYVFKLVILSYDTAKLRYIIESAKAFDPARCRLSNY